MLATQSDQLVSYDPLIANSFSSTGSIYYWGIRPGTFAALPCQFPCRETQDKSQSILQYQTDRSAIVGKVDILEGSTKRLMPPNTDLPSRPVQAAAHIKGDFSE